MMNERPTRFWLKYADSTGNTVYEPVLRRKLKNAGTKFTPKKKDMMKINYNDIVSPSGDSLRGISDSLSKSEDMNINEKSAEIIIVQYFYNRGTQTEEKFFRKFPKETHVKNVRRSPIQPTQNQNHSRSNVRDMDIQTEYYKPKDTSSFLLKTTNDYTSNNPVTNDHNPYQPLNIRTDKFRKPVGKINKIKDETTTNVSTDDIMKLLDNLIKKSQSTKTPANVEITNENNPNEFKNLFKDCMKMNIMMMEKLDDKRRTTTNIDELSSRKEKSDNDFTKDLHNTFRIQRKLSMFSRHRPNNVSITYTRPNQPYFAPTKTSFNSEWYDCLRTSDSSLSIRSFNKRNTRPKSTFRNQSTTSHELHRHSDNNYGARRNNSEWMTIRRPLNVNVDRLPKRATSTIIHQNHHNRQHN
ncbi:hypothetical protein SNEBB_009109 [Seison nebaliae]|nr:hypothetical protein SNEBB_009109 [Seison nebaliae]